MSPEGRRVREPGSDAPAASEKCTALWTTLGCSVWLDLISDETTNVPGPSVIGIGPSFIALGSIITLAAQEMLYKSESRKQIRSAVAAALCANRAVDSLFDSLKRPICLIGTRIQNDVTLNMTMTACSAGLG